MLFSGTAALFELCLVGRLLSLAKYFDQTVSMDSNHKKLRAAAFPASNSFLCVNSVFTSSVFGG